MYRKERAFTLIELLVVMGIISVLVTIVFASLSVARGKSRDAKRIADLSQIKFALELYFDEHGHFPCEVPSACSGQGSTNANGKVGEGGGLDTLLAPYLGTVPHDPLGPGDATHYYYYDGKHICVGQPWDATVLFAATVEDLANVNFESTECADPPSDPDGLGNAGRSGTSNDSYNIILGPSSG